MRRPVLALMFCLVTGFAGSALADGYGPLPRIDGTSSPLQMQIVGYRGGTNGEMVVKIRNPTGRARQEVDPARGRASQREGAEDASPRPSLPAAAAHRAPAGAAGGAAAHRPAVNTARGCAANGGVITSSA